MDIWYLWHTSAYPMRKDNMARFELSVRAVPSCYIDYPAFRGLILGNFGDGGIGPYIEFKGMSIKFEPLRELENL